MEKVYANPFDKETGKTEVLTVAFLFFFAGILAIVTQKWQAGLVPLVIAILAGLVFFAANLQQFPTIVRVEGGGIVLQFKWKRSIQVPWPQLADIRLRPIEGNKGRYGSLRIKGNPTPYHVTREIAVEIEKGYANAIGLPIPRWDGKRTSKVAPKD